LRRSHEPLVHRGIDCGDGTFEAEATDRDDQCCRHGIHPATRCLISREPVNTVPFMRSNVVGGINPNVAVLERH